MVVHTPLGSKSLALQTRQSASSLQNFDTLPTVLSSNKTTKVPLQYADCDIMVKSYDTRVAPHTAAAEALFMTQPELA